MRFASEEGGAMHHTQRRVPLGQQPSLLRKLPPGAHEWILAVVARSGRNLPRGDVPRMPPLSNQHRVAVVEIRHDEG